jgi:hypothetical protein
MSESTMIPRSSKSPLGIQLSTTAELVDRFWSSHRRRDSGGQVGMVTRRVETVGTSELDQLTTN